MDAAPIGNFEERGKVGTQADSGSHALRGTASSVPIPNWPKEVDQNSNACEVDSGKSNPCTRKWLPSKGGCSIDWINQLSSHLLKVITWTRRWSPGAKNQKFTSCKGALLKKHDANFDDSGRCKMYCLEFYGSYTGGVQIFSFSLHVCVSHVFG